MQGSFSPYFQASPSTFSTYASSRPVGSMRQASAENSSTLYRNTSPTVSVPQSRQQRPQQSVGDSMFKNVKRFSDYATKFKRVYDDFNKANTTRNAIASNESYQVPMDTGVGNPEVYATPELQVAPELSTGIEAGTVTGAEAGSVEAGVIASETTAETALAAETGTAATSTTGASATSGLSSTGVGAIVAAVIMAELYADSYNNWRNTDPESGELKTKQEANTSGTKVTNTGTAFEGKMFTDPGMTALLGDKKNATAGEVMDAYTQQGDFGGMMSAYPSAINYWADPGMGILKMSSDRFLGTNIQGFENQMSSSLGKAFGMI